MAEDIQHVGRVASFQSFENLIEKSGGMTIGELSRLSPEEIDKLTPQQILGLSSEQIAEKALILTSGTPSHVTGAIITDLQTGEQYTVGTIAKRDGSNYSPSLPSLNWQAVLAKLRSLGYSGDDLFGIAVTGKMYP